MGNCVRKDSDVQWGGDYWGSPSSSPEKSLLSGKHQPEAEAEAEAEEFSSFQSHVKREVKIKISKKQLEELLGMKEMQGLTLQQVLNQLINGGLESNQGSWRPALHSIPE